MSLACSVASLSHPSVITCLCVNIYILIFINIYIYIILGGLLSVHLSIYLVLLRVCVRQDCIRAHKVSVPVETIRYVRMRQHAR